MKFYALIFLLSIPLLAMDIPEIREWYGTVHDMMAEGELYRTSLEINADTMSYPAVGLYNQSISLHWGLDQENYPEEELLFVSVLAHYAAITEYREYLFDRSGSLVFHFRSGGYEELEERYYFSEGNLIRLTVNGEMVEEPSVEHGPEAAAVLQEAEDLLQSFMLIH